MKFIDLSVQQSRLRSGIEARIRAVLDHGCYILGPEVSELEQRLAGYVGARECIGAASGTDALLMALMALDVGPGDEVVTSPFSFAATVETILLLGAVPVYADIDLDSFNLNADAIGAALSPRTKAIVAVSLYGQCADIESIAACAPGVPIVEDAAQSFGATRHGRRSCGLTTLGCTSFFPSKPLGCYGDGGAVFSDDPELTERVRQIRTHGQASRYEHVCIGINGRLDTIQAAIVLEKLTLFDEEVALRQQVAERYRLRLADANALTLPVVSAGNTSVYAQYTVRVAQRDTVRERLAAHGIPTAVHYPKALHQQPAYAGRGRAVGRLLNAEQAAGEVLSLPMYPYLSEQDQDVICEALVSAVTC